MITLTRECPKYGIYFAFTATNTMAVRYRMLQNFRRMYVMQMNDKADYNSILGNTGGVIPPAVKGRGILKTDETYVFQTARIVGEEEDLLNFIKQFAAKLTQRAAGVRARQIPVVPRFVSGLDAANHMNTFEQLPLGISYSTYSYLKINAAEKNVLLVIAENGRDALRYAGGIIETVSAVEGIRTVVFNGGRELEELLDVAYDKVDGDYESRIVELFGTCVLRNNNYKDTDGHPTVDMTPLLIVLNGYEKIMAGLSADGKDKLTVMLDYIEGFCNMYFVICDSCRSVNQYYMENWVGSRCGGEGVWVGSGIENQMRLTITKRTKELERKADGRTGFYVAGGTARLMRLVMPSKLENGVEEDEE